MTDLTTSADPQRRPALSRTIKWATLLGLALAVCVGTCLAILKALPYSTTIITAGAARDLLAAPTPEFNVGPLSWHVSDLATDPSLDAFRQEFRAHCGNKVGVDAAVCVSDRMAHAFPNGEPSTEFVNPAFDPTAHLRTHLEGQGGHCLTRSAILATELLSVGVPARVVQIFPPQRLSGHTVTEVWNGSGWTVVDATYGVVLHSRQGPASMNLLLSGDATVDWLRAGAVAKGTTAPLAPSTYARGTALYPEPWLYLRVGPRRTIWPFRARFVRTGQARLPFGPAQHALWLAILTLGAAAVVCFAVAWLSHRRARGVRPLSEGAPAASVLLSHEHHHVRAQEAEQAQ